MDQLIQVLIIGLANGLIFALVALGYTLVYGIIELINFAHGDVFMLGSMLAYFLIAPASAGAWGVFPITVDTPLPLKIAEILAVLAICMVVMGILNVLIERIAYRPLRNAPKLAISGVATTCASHSSRPACGTPNDCARTSKYCSKSSPSTGRTSNSPLTA